MKDVNPDAREDILFLLEIIDQLADGQRTLYELHTAELAQITDIRTEWEESPDQVASALCQPKDEDYR